MSLGGWWKTKTEPLQTYSTPVLANMVARVMSMMMINAHMTITSIIYSMETLQLLQLLKFLEFYLFPTGNMFLN